MNFKKPLAAAAAFLLLFNSKGVQANQDGNYPVIKDQEHDNAQQISACEYKPAEFGTLPPPEESFMQKIRKKLVYKPKYHFNGACHYSCPT